MSSPAPTFSTTIFGPTETPSDGDSSGGGMQRGASYFFGFLITFVVLLFTFAGCGILSRRRFTARHRTRSGWTMAPWAERMEGGDMGFIPPLLVEKNWVRAEEGSLWKDLIPLAAMVIPPDNKHERTRNIDTKIDTPATTLSSAPGEHSRPLGSQNSALFQESSHSRNPDRSVIPPHGEGEDTHRPHGVFRYLAPTSWLGPLGRRERSQGEYNGNDVELGTQNPGHEEKINENGDEVKQDVLQVVVMIEMPSPRTSPSGSVSSHRSEYEVGVAQLPWSALVDTQDHEHGH